MSDDVRRAVAKYLAVHDEDGPRNEAWHRRAADARETMRAALRAIDLGDGRHMSLTEIGLLMGGKDHSTVCYYLGRRGSYVPVAERRRVAAEAEATLTADVFRPGCDPVPTCGDCA